MSMSATDCATCFINQLWTVNCSVLRYLGGYSIEVKDKQADKETPDLSLSEDPRRKGEEEKDEH